MYNQALLPVCIVALTPLAWAVDLNRTYSWHPTALVARKEPADTLNCNPSDSLYYVKQAAMGAHGEAFCADVIGNPKFFPGSKFERMYDDDRSMRKLKIWVEYPADTIKGVDQGDCLWAVDIINNGCNIPTDQDGNNPWNWKHGGSVKDQQGVVYHIDPQIKRQPAPKKVESRCVLGHNGGYWSFAVGGIGWSDDDFGDKLDRYIQTCGTKNDGRSTGIGGWTFDYKHATWWDGFKSEWVAGGNIGQGAGTSCIANAIEAAGGGTYVCSWDIPGPPDGPS